MFKRYFNQSGKGSRKQNGVQKCRRSDHFDAQTNIQTNNEKIQTVSYVRHPATLSNENSSDTEEQQETRNPHASVVKSSLYPHNDLPNKFRDPGTEDEKNLAAIDASQFGFQASGIPCGQPSNNFNSVSDQNNIQSLEDSFLFPVSPSLPQIPSDPLIVVKKENEDSAYVPALQQVTDGLTVCKSNYSMEIANPIPEPMSSINFSYSSSLGPPLLAAKVEVTHSSNLFEKYIPDIVPDSQDFFYIEPNLIMNRAEEPSRVAETFSQHQIPENDECMILNDAPVALDNIENHSLPTKGLPPRYADNLMSTPTTLHVKSNMVRAEASHRPAMSTQISQRSAEPEFGNLSPLRHPHSFSDSDDDVIVCSPEISCVPEPMTPRNQRKNTKDEVIPNMEKSSGMSDLQNQNDFQKLSPNVRKSLDIACSQSSKEKSDTHNQSSQQPTEWHKKYEREVNIMVEDFHALLAYRASILPTDGSAGLQCCLKIKTVTGAEISDYERYSFNICLDQWPEQSGVDVMVAPGKDVIPPAKRKKDIISDLPATLDKPTKKRKSVSTTQSYSSIPKKISSKPKDEAKQPLPGKESAESCSKKKTKRVRRLSKKPSSRKTKTISNQTDPVSKTSCASVSLKSAKNISETIEKGKKKPVESQSSLQSNLNEKSSSKSEKTSKKKLSKQVKIDNTKPSIGKQNNDTTCKKLSSKSTLIRPSSSDEKKKDVKFSKTDSTLPSLKRQLSVSSPNNGLDASEKPKKGKIGEIKPLKSSESSKQPACPQSSDSINHREENVATSEEIRYIYDKIHELTRTVTELRRRSTMNDSLYPETSPVASSFYRRRGRANKKRFRVSRRNIQYPIPNFSNSDYFA